MFSNILAAIAAIPKLVDAIQALVGEIKKQNLLAYMRSAAETRSEILNAKTKEDYAKAASDLHSLVAKL